MNERDLTDTIFEATRRMMQKDATIDSLLEEVDILKKQVRNLRIISNSSYGKFGQHVNTKMAADIFEQELAAWRASHSSVEPTIVDHGRGVHVNDRPYEKGYEQGYQDAMKAAQIQLLNSGVDPTIVEKVTGMV